MPRGIVTSIACHSIACHFPQITTTGKSVGMCQFHMIVMTAEMFRFEKRKFLSMYVPNGEQGSSCLHTFQTGNSTDL